MWTFVRNVATIAGGVILGEEVAKSPKAHKLGREIRDEVRRGLHETAKGIASAAQNCAEYFAEKKPATNEAPKA